MRKILLALVVLVAMSVQSQELNALVTINSEKVQSTNKQVYETLQKSLTELLNQTKWTNRSVKPQERINCAFSIIVNAQDGNQFDASLQIQTTRPVYNSTYETPVLNINDQSFSFQYNEFDPLLYNRTRFDSNLVSTIVFYVYVVLGVDADTFALKGGEKYLKEAQNVMLQAQQSGIGAWQNQVGENNRFALIDNLLSQKFSVLRSVYYNYHRKGLDEFYKNEKGGKQQLETSVSQLQRIHNITVGNYMIRIFLDAKSDEIVSIFTDGKPSRNQQRMVQVLEKISPTNNRKWKKIN